MDEKNLANIISIFCWGLAGIALAWLLTAGATVGLARWGEISPVIPGADSEKIDPASNRNNKKWTPVDQLYFVQSPVSEENTKKDKESEYTADESGIQQVQSSQLPLELVGTLSGAKNHRIAIIRNLKTDEKKYLQVGDEWDQIIVKDVAAGWVQLYNKKTDQVEILRLKRASHSVMKSESESNAQKVSRFQINQAIQSNLNNLLAAVDAGPYLKNGEIVGFELKELSGKPGRLIRELGFQEGDVVTRVNNHKIDSVERAMTLWAQLRNQTDFRITILRGGKRQRLEYSMTR